MFRKFFGKGILVRSLNKTFVCLTPKKERTVKIKDFRPISLVTSLYKVLANKLQKVLPLTVSVALITNKVIEDYRS